MRSLSMELVWISEQLRWQQAFDAQRVNWEEVPRWAEATLASLQSDSRSLVEDLSAGFRQTYHLLVQLHELMEQNQGNRDQLEQLLAASPEAEEKFRPLFVDTEARASELARQCAVNRSTAVGYWDVTWRLVQNYQTWKEQYDSSLSHLSTRKVRDVFLASRDELASLSDRLIDLMRSVMIEYPEWDLSFESPQSEVWTVRLSPLAYLRSMWNLFWSCIRHPLSETTIDLSTGRVLYRT
jgi:hypothetical protein